MGELRGITDLYLHHQSRPSLLITLYRLLPAFKTSGNCVIGYSGPLGGAGTFLYSIGGGKHPFAGPNGSGNSVARYAGPQVSAVSNLYQHSYQPFPVPNGPGNNIAIYARLLIRAVTFPQGIDIARR